MIEIRRRLLDALLLTDVLPQNLPMPSVHIDDYLDVSFEWYVDSGNLMCVWLRDGRVSYAGMLDGESLHGIAPLEDFSMVPKECLEVVKFLATIIEKQKKP